MSRKQRRGYRHANVPHVNRIRVRAKRRDQVDDTKLFLAYWLLARQQLEERTDPRALTEDEVRQAADELRDSDGRPTDDRGEAS